jgi:hypothetical protein
MTGLYAFAIVVGLLPDAAQAGNGLYAHSGGVGLPGAIYRPAAFGFGFGFRARYYGHPLDDSYDYPSGYGEYAEYGPWAQRVYSGCYVTQVRVLTYHGLRRRWSEICR